MCYEYAIIDYVVGDVYRFSTKILDYERIVENHVTFDDKAKRFENADAWSALRVSVLFEIPLCWPTRWKFRSSFGWNLLFIYFCDAGLSDLRPKTTSDVMM